MFRIPSSHPPTEEITIVAAGDVIFCSGFEGGDACDGASGEGIYTTRAQFAFGDRPGASLSEVLG